MTLGIPVCGNTLIILRFLPATAREPIWENPPYCASQPIRGVFVFVPVPVKTA